MNMSKVSLRAQTFVVFSCGAWVPTPAPCGAVSTKVPQPNTTKVCVLRLVKSMSSDQRAMGFPWLAVCYWIISFVF